MNPEPRKTGTYELPPGSVVGKYEIMRRLAVGGMAEMYLARVTGAAGFEKLVVLKRILPSVAEDPTFVQMFLDEAKLAATLRHPNIADVYDVGEHDGTYFFTMEYVYGQDLRAVRHEVKRRGERIPLAIALATVHAVASALDHAHEKLGPDGKPLGLVHRDVSASNVMVSYDGAVKLLDFGIARASSSTHKTQIGTLKGKIPYMSPEQCKGLALDRRSDLFSLGTVLYELTVGKRPFRGESDFEVMDQIVYQGAKPPSEVVADYPPDLEAIVMKLLARGPSMRYPTGEDLLHDLDELIQKHGLWLSPRAIGKYMRTTFADKIQAWEQAEQEGVPFAQHVVQTITSQSQRSELLTPPSAFSGVGPRTTSQQMLAMQAPRASSEETYPRPSTTQELAAAYPFRRTSEVMAVPVPMPGPVLLPLIAPESAPVRVPAVAVYEPDSTPFEKQSAPSLPVYPELKPQRSSRTILLAFFGALVLGAGGVVGFLLNRSDKPAAVAVEPDEPAKQMVESVEPPKAARVEEVKAAPVEDAKPAPIEEAKPAAAPVVEPTVRVEPEQEPSKPVVRKPPSRPSKKKPATNQPKEQTWDPNSPFLPQ